MNKFLTELKSFLLIIAAVFIFRSTIVNWYVIPTGSLLPTIKIGDHVVVNKLSYGLMLPFMRTSIISWAHPHRGDIVVFEGPEEDNSLTLIKRVIGVPGDHVSFTNGVLTINGVLANEKIFLDKGPLENMGGTETGDDYFAYIESGFSNYPHYIMKKKWGGQTAAETKTWVVPPHKLLLMGDNRDNSLDGRYWGFMDENRIYGRAFAVSYSTYDTPDSWFPSFRKDRWFIKINN